MRDQVALGALAIVAGVLVGIVLFVPFVAVSYRRRGGLTFGRFALWFALLVYVLAIWTYTLLPLPSPESIRCAGVNLDPLDFVGDIRGAISRGSPLTDPAVLQLVLNVMLFLPLGFFVRGLFRRGILVALLSGFGLSLFIECTQLTGVWGLYPCAYRVFDVVDLMTNTLGAVLGVTLALLLPRAMRVRDGERIDADRPRPVTSLRRLIGMLCDLLVVGLGSIAILLPWQIVDVLLRGSDAAADDDAIAQLVANLVLIVVTLTWTLVTGRTPGNAAVQLRYTGSRLPSALARIMRYVGGIGGFQLLNLLPGEYGSWLVPLFVLVSFILVFPTRTHRGLPGLVSGQRLVDARAVEEREPVAADS
nr:VanZ family protein [Microbacterium lemovicicum]